MTPLHLFLVSAIAIIPPLVHQPTELPDEIKIEGLYLCAGGHGADAYQCAVAITRRGENYRMKWVFDSGQMAAGIGQRDGDALWVAWGDHEVLGLCRYRVQWVGGKPRLVGDKGTTEILTFVRPLE
jgi:hypothetical protein